MNAERRIPDRYGKWLPILLPVLVAAAGVVSVWAVNGDRLAQAERDIEYIESSYTPREVTELHLIPLRQDIEHIKDSMQRLEKMNWEILQQIKATVGGHAQ